MAALIRSRKEKTKKANAITCLFLDIGGVLLTDGWDHNARKRAATSFKLKWTHMEARHQLTWLQKEDLNFEEKKLVPHCWL
ncbi:MAG: hypothetical protein ABR881_08575 [Candidatus Sulfotelmatobacter sp.]